MRLRRGRGVMCGTTVVWNAERAACVAREAGFMTKSELIQHIADMNPHLYHQDVERIVATIFDEIADALAEGKRVELRGFGAFSVKDREPRTGRNPRTGDPVTVEAKRVPFFKTGKQLHERLNASDSDS